MMFDRDFRQGMRDSLPIVVGAAPFGLLFGALAVENGLDVYQAVLMSAVLNAGASQMVGIDLFGNNVAPWIIVLSIFAVNFRHVLYSASIGPKMTGFSPLQKAIAFFFLVDPQFAEAEKRYERGQRVSFNWYMGAVLSLYSTWILETAIGAYFGRLIKDPHAYGVDFMLPIYFLVLVMSFRRRRNWMPVVLASGVASVVAYHLVGSPWHVSIGAIAGVVLAAIMAGGGTKPETVNADAEGGQLTR
ncbi:AzlC family ABC transporter permease [Hoeflea prorocentri]|uniref:AzlC family ABC transporter permease n=1 Tax=Hoeflea prorocentri TaxID=1922333 RepID=A0A9X3UJJ3_9HYPH|nr:AzlC family ABC transporter permease [Hoeflea prorocentri]MCY6379926.1 AzlC family ABC transporter permease [Hoeflea prorocentri]MDA5397726.1 AzlC family ABC transporter permease [Hoeflea prorocentri]